MSIALEGRPEGHLSIVMMILNLGAIAAVIYRVKTFPDEAAGWWLFAAYLPLALVLNGLIVWWKAHAPGFAFGAVISLGVQLPITLLEIWGLLRLPWRGGRKHKPVVLLGGALFGGSLALLLWMLNFLPMHGVQGRTELLMFDSFVARVAVTGGVTAYLLADDPRRIRGPLGWLLLRYTLAGSAVLVTWKLLAMHPGHGLPAISSLCMISPISMILIAFHKVPAEVPEDAPNLSWPFVDALLYLPYATALVVMAALAMGQLRLNYYAFFGLTAILLLHQFLLQREVRSARDTLELKVQERTRELKEAQALALRSERANTMALLGAGMAHDLNNALMVVGGSIEVMKMKAERGIVPESGDMERIQKAAERCAGLSQRLMAFGRSQEDQPTYYDVNRVVQKCEDLFRMIVPKRIRLEVEPGEERLRAHGVPDHLEQVLINLVSNAKDAIPGNGSIRVELSPDQRADESRWARLTIRDTGTGMPPEVLGRLFQPYFTTKKPGSGTGLGLASTKAILERCGADIQVASEVGEGTTFTVFVPLGGVGQA